MLINSLSGVFAETVNMTQSFQAGLSYTFDGLETLEKQATPGWTYAADIFQFIADLPFLLQARAILSGEPVGFILNSGHKTQHGQALFRADGIIAIV